jgi:uncharacterized protein
MVKPAGALCNLDCPYCFYLHKTDLLEHERNARMSDAVLEQHIRQYLEANTGDEVVFSWQGGEPTVLGLPFFERVVAAAGSAGASPGQRIENDLQTNGILLDERVGRVPEGARASSSVCPSTGRPICMTATAPPRAAGRHTPRSCTPPRVLRRASVPFAALCVVNREVAQRPLEVYRFLVDEVGSWRIQFTPCVESRELQADARPGAAPAAQMPTWAASARGPGTRCPIVTDWSVDARDWGFFLCTVWDEWLARDFGRIHVNHFETAVAQSLGMPAQMCTSAPICGKALALEHDGRLYSCDHFVYPEYELGRIRDVHEGDLAFSPRQVEFGTAKHDRLPRYCRECPSLKLCWGECPKNRLLRTPDGEAGLNYLCEGLKAFYARVQRDMPDHPAPTRSMNTLEHLP